MDVKSFGEGGSVSLKTLDCALDHVCSSWAAQHPPAPLLHHSSVSSAVQAGRQAAVSAVPQMLIEPADPGSGLDRVCEHRGPLTVPLLELSCEGPWTSLQVVSERTSLTRWAEDVVFSTVKCSRLVDKWKESCRRYSKANTLKEYRHGFIASGTLGQSTSQRADCCCHLVVL